MQTTALRRVRGPLGLLPGLVLLLLVACRTEQAASEQQVIFAVEHGEYSRALQQANRLAKANPKDERAQLLHREAQVAFLLDKGREEVFHGDLALGLEYFERAHAVAPDHATVASWISKTRAQLADHWLDVAAERTGPEHLSEAEQAYEKVLYYDGENGAARRGLAHVLLLKNYRAGMSKTYFDDGLSTFRELQLEQARRAFQISQRYRENDPAVLRRGQVEVMMAEERLAQAKDLEATGMFFAARNEYRLVLLIDPSNSEGRAGLDRMDRETRATRTLAEADMEIRRGQLDDAKETLAKVEILTKLQKDELSLLRSDIDERRLDQLYQEARGLTDDYRYPDAVETYGTLLGLAPDYRDAALRKATLEEFIAMSEEFYANALEATDDVVAEEWLRAIPVIWPEYKDVSQRLEAIEARKQSAPEEIDEDMDTSEESGAPGAEPGDEPE